MAGETNETNSNGKTQPPPPPPPPPPSSPPPPPSFNLPDLYKKHPLHPYLYPLTALEKNIHSFKQYILGEHFDSPRPNTPEYQASSEEEQDIQEQDIHSPHQFDKNSKQTRKISLLEKMKDRGIDHEYFVCLNCQNMCLPFEHASTRKLKSNNGQFGMKIDQKVRLVIDYCKACSERKQLETTYRNPRKRKREKKKNN